MTVPNSRFEGMFFLYCDVGFNFVSDMCIEVTSVDVDIIGRIVILLGPVHSVGETLRLKYQTSRSGTKQGNTEVQKLS